MATINERENGSYQIVVFLGRDSAGKRMFKRTTFKPTAKRATARKHEVDTFAAEFERQVLNGSYYEGNEMTFSKLYDKWLNDWAKKNLSQRTLEDYKALIERAAIPNFGGMTLSKIKVMHLMDIYNRMSDNGTSAATVKKYHAAINSVFKFAYKMDIIKENPCDRCTMPKMKKDNTLHFFTQEQAQTFLKALDASYEVEHKAHTRTLKSTGKEYSVPTYTETATISTMFKAYFTLAVFSGARKGELVALTWKDIDFENCTIDISKSVSFTKAFGEYEKDPKTAAGFRDFKLPKRCFDVLRKWRTEEKRMRLSMGTAWQGADNFDDTWIFIKEDGSRMHIDTPYAKFKDIIRMHNATANKKDQLPDIRLHDLRHTSASLLLSEGIDITEVSRRLGHANSYVTLNVYAHAMPKTDEKAASVLDALFA